MPNGATDSKVKRSALAVILLLIAIGVVVWVLLAMMGCGAPGEQDSGEAAGAGAESLEGAALAEMWLPAKGTLYSENPETGELERSADVSVERDASGRVTRVEEVSYADGAESARTTTRYEYGEAGEVVSREIAYASATSEASPETTTSDYTYDDDLLTIISTPESESTGRELFDYDEHGHLITIMQTYDLEASTRTYLTHIEYNAQDLPIAATSGEGDSTTSATWSYEADGQLATFSLLPMGEGVTNLMDYSLAYDDAGHVSTVACAPGDFIAAQHGDAQKVGYDADVTYTYDERGRCSGARATGTYTYGATFETSAECAYDDHGNLARVDFTDANAMDGDASTRRYALELEFERVALAEDVDAPTATLLHLVPTYDKRLFAMYAAQPSLPVAPHFSPEFASATYFGYQPILASY